MGGVSYIRINKHSIYVARLVGRGRENAVDNIYIYYAVQRRMLLSRNF